MLAALVPAGVVIVTSTGPALVAAAAVAVMEVSLLTVHEDAAVDPKLTAVNPVPVTVGERGPACLRPLAGLRPVMAGGAVTGWV